MEGKGTKPKENSFWKSKLFLMLISSFLALFIGEVCIRISGLINKRSLFFSSETFQLDESGGVRYIPYQRIRTVAVYDGIIEYDVSFRTNNLGFVDDVDYQYNDGIEGIAFVGNSFTAGFHSGQPWIPELRKQLANDSISLYNLGIGGTGVTHFHNLLNSVREEIYFNHIIITAISDDLKRPAWEPLAMGNEIRFCLAQSDEQNCLKKPYIARIIDETDSEEKLIQLSNETKNHQSILHHSHLAQFFAGLIKMKKRNQKDLLHNRLTLLEKIRQDFPQHKITLFHLPIKIEAITGEYLTGDIQDIVTSMGIEYYPALTSCEWEEKMFFKQDAHPNAEGYRNIQKCVSDFLDKGE